MVGNVLALNPVTLTLGGFASQPMTQGFTSRSAVTYTEQVEGIRQWILDDLIPFLEVNSGQDVWDLNAASLQTQVNAALTAEQTAVTTALTDAVNQVINATILVTDPIVVGLINNLQSQARLALDALYVHQVHSAPNPATGWFHVDDFGAVGDGTAHDSVAIQAAIDAASAVYTANGVKQRVYFGPKVYLCEATQTQNPVYALMLKNGVELYGKGTLKVAPGSYWIGTDYALIRSPVAGLQDAGIRDLTIDGNKSAFSNIPGGNTQANNITLRTCTNVSIINIQSTRANGTGIMVAGSSSNLSHDVRIQDCLIDNCGNIGIQCAQFDGLAILNNRLAWNTDNAIDIYGEPDSHSGGSTGLNFTINGNKINDCGNGIFPETVARGVIENNSIRNVYDGIHVNRINAEPNNILITGNYIFNCQNAVNCTGDTGGVTIRNNTFEYYNLAGVSLGGAGRVSQYYILDNTMNGNSTTIPCVLIRSGTDQCASVVHLRTMTKNRNRTYDTVNYCTNNAANSFGVAFSPGD